MLQGMNTSRIILALLACFALQACGGGDHDACEDQPPVIVVTVVAPGGAVTEYRFTEGTQVAHLVEIQHQNPDAAVSVHAESACAAH